MYKTIKERTTLFIQNPTEKTAKELCFAYTASYDRPSQEHKDMLIDFIIDNLRTGKNYEDVLASSASIGNRTGMFCAVGSMKSMELINSGDITLFKLLELRQYFEQARDYKIKGRLDLSGSIAAQLKEINTQIRILSPDNFSKFTTSILTEDTTSLTFSNIEGYSDFKLPTEDNNLSKKDFRYTIIELKEKALARRNEASKKSNNIDESLSSYMITINALLLLTTMSDSSEKIHDGWMLGVNRNLSKLLKVFVDDEHITETNSSTKCKFHIKSKNFLDSDNTKQPNMSRAQKLAIVKMVTDVQFTFSKLMLEWLNKLSLEQTQQNNLLEILHRTQITKLEKSLSNPNWTTSKKPKNLNGLIAKKRGQLKTLQQEIGAQKDFQTFLAEIKSALNETLTNYQLLAETYSDDIELKVKINEIKNIMGPDNDAIAAFHEKVYNTLGEFMHPSNSLDLDVLGKIWTVYPRKPSPLVAASKTNPLINTITRLNNSLESGNSNSNLAYDFFRLAITSNHEISNKISKLFDNAIGKQQYLLAIYCGIALKSESKIIEALAKQQESLHQEKIAGRLTGLLKEISSNNANSATSSTPTTTPPTPTQVYGKFAFNKKAAQPETDTSLRTPNGAKENYPQSESPDTSYLNPNAVF